MTTTTKTPEQRMRVLRLMLRQIRAANGSWTDGQRIFEGEDLDLLRKQVIDKLVQLRGPKPGWGGRPHEFGNIAAILGMKARTNKAPLPPIEERLLDLAVTSDRSPVGEGRSRVIARMLKDRHPDTYARLPIERRHTPQVRQHVLAALQRKGGKVAEDYTERGITIAKGTIVQVHHAGGAALVDDRGRLRQIMVPLDKLAPMRARDYKQLQRRVAQCAPASDIGELSI